MRLRSFLLITVFSLLLMGKSYASDTACPSIANFSRVSPGVYRGGAPDDVGLDCLQSLGVERILDLEATRFWKIIPERRYVQSLGMEFIRAPMYAFPFFYSRLSRVRDSQMDKILDLLDDGKEHPIFVHCLKGNDRTGLVIGLHRVVNEGMDLALAWNEMLQFNFHPHFRSLTRYFESRTGFDPDDDPTDENLDDSPDNSLDDSAHFRADDL